MIDTHCHLTHPRLAGDEAEVVARARETGLTACISIGTAILFFGLWWSERQGRKAEGQLGNEPEEGPSMLEFSE